MYSSAHTQGEYGPSQGGGGGGSHVQKKPCYMYMVMCSLSPITYITTVCYCPLLIFILKETLCHANGTVYRL